MPLPRKDDRRPYDAPPPRRAAALLTIPLTAGWLALAGPAFAQDPYPYAAPLAAAQVSYAQPPAAAPNAAAAESFFEPGRLVAVVGEESILAGHLTYAIEERMQQREKAAPGRPLSPMERERLTRGALYEVAVRRMIAQKFLSDAAGNKPVAQREEAREKILQQLNKAFYEQYVPQLTKRYEAADELDLNRKLQADGTSLESQRVGFMDQMLMSELFRSEIPEKPYVDNLDVRDRYDKELESWHRPARARFQRMSVLFRRIPDRQAAYHEIMSMYEEVRLGGAPFAAVATRRSQGPNAEQGGLFDWTTKGALVSVPIDQAVFSIELHRLSQIIEDADGYHFIVVLEREPERTVPFSEAQHEIKKKLVDEKKRELQNDLIKKLQRETAVWSLWPEDIPGARPLSELTGQSADAGG